MRLPARTPARELGFVYIAGPALGLIGLLASEAPGANLTALFVAIATPWAIGVVLLSGRLDPLGPGTVSVVLALGTVAASIGVLFGGRAAYGLAFFYLWTTPFAFMLLSRRRAAVQVLLVGLCFAGVIVIQESFVASNAPPRAGLGRWVYVVGTVALVGVVVRALASWRKAIDDRFRRAFHESPIGQTIADAHGRYIDVNDAFGRIVGRPVSDIVGRHFREMTHPDDVAISNKALVTTTSGQPAIDFRKRYIRPDGEARTASITYSALETRTDVGRQLYAQVVDITEQLEATAAATAQVAARTEERVRHTRQQEALAQLGQAALQDLELTGLFQLACDLAVDGIGADSCAVSQLLPSGAEFEVVVCAGRATDQKGVRVQLPDAAAVNKFVDPRPVIYAMSDRRYGVVPSASWGTGDVVTVLISSGRRPFGRLAMIFEPHHDFGSDDDVRFLRSAASILGSAIARQESDLRRRDLLRRLVIAQEEERAHVASDIHDDSLQVIAASRLQVHRLRNTLSGEAETRAHVVEDVLGDAAERLRLLLFKLYPPAINVDGGLESALRELGNRTSQEGGLTVAFDFQGALNIDMGVRVLIYRTVQEALVNTTKHAAAKQAWIGIRRTEGLVSVSVRDNGSGFDPSFEPPAGHLGLVATRERIEDAGGTMRIDSGFGIGTSLEVELPVAAQN